MSKRKSDFKGGYSLTKIRKVDPFSGILSKEDSAKLHQISVSRVGVANSVCESRAIWKECLTVADSARWHTKHQKKVILSTITATSVLLQFIAQRGYSIYDVAQYLDVADHATRGSTNRVKIVMIDPSKGKVIGNFALACRDPIALNNENENKLKLLLRKNFELKNDEEVIDCVAQLRSIIRDRLKSARSATKTRNKLGRDHVNSELDEKWGLEKYLEQNGRCHYSNRLLSLFKRCNDSQKYQKDMLSRERLDVSVGYTKENTVWCCIQYNSPIQFTLEMRKCFLNGQSIPIGADVFDSLRNALLEPPSRLGEKKPKRTETVNGKWPCDTCHRELDREEFYMQKYLGVETPRSYCKRCQSDKQRAVYEGPRGFCLSLLSNCRMHCKKRQKSFEKENELREKRGETLVVPHPDAFSYELSLDWLVKEQCIAKQGFRCHTSRHPLTPRPGFFNSISIERLDETIGYTRENSVLTCAWFQNGHCQWTAAMFQEDFQCATK